MTDFLWVFGLPVVGGIVGLLAWAALLMFEGVFLDND